MAHRAQMPSSSTGRGRGEFLYFLNPSISPEIKNQYLHSAQANSEEVAMSTDHAQQTPAEQSVETNFDEPFDTFEELSKLANLLDQVDKCETKLRIHLGDKVENLILRLKNKS